MDRVILKKGRERSLVRRHPWVFSGAIDRVDGEPAAGAPVCIADERGEALAWGYFNESSKIQVRVLDWNPEAVIDRDWWKHRLQRAVDMRVTLPGGMQGEAQRLVYSEADGLPGLIVDRYGDCLVVQVLTAGIERVKGELVELLTELLDPSLIYERSDADARSLEGLAPHAGLLAGALPQAPLTIMDNGVRLCVDIERGHKTGLYIDQCQNRRLVSIHGVGRKVLDLFCYTGAFGISAVQAGAEHVTMVDSSSEALAMARVNAEANAAADRCEFVQGNSFEVVRGLQRHKNSYGLVICDPPRLAPSKGQLARAERAYKDINMNAMQLVEPGGFLATFSCSGAMHVDNFSKIIAWAAIDVHRDVRIVHRMSQGPDHPVDPCFPESEYLKGLVCKVM